MFLKREVVSAQVLCFWVCRVQQKGPLQASNTAVCGELGIGNVFIANALAEGWGGLLAPPAWPWPVWGVQRWAPLKPQLLEACD